MIKLVYIIRRRADFSPQAFRERWLVTHGPLVKAAAKALHARRYIQSHTVDTPFNAALASSRGMGEAYDGITEVWWDDMDALASGMGSDEGRVAAQRLLDDEHEFIDFENSRVFLTEEHVIFDYTTG